MHEFPVYPVESGDSVEDISPNVKIIPLMDDPVIIPKSQLGASIHRRAGEPLEHHHHLPLHKGLIRIHHNRYNVHIQLLAARRQPVAHRRKIFNPLDFLNNVSFFILELFSARHVFRV